MVQRHTKHEFEIAKEGIESEIRGYQIEVLEIKRDIAANQVEAVGWDREKSSEDIRKSRLGYEQAKLGNDISEQKKSQLEDNLDYEKAMTLLNRESLMVQGKSALLGLQQAQADLEQNSELFELRYNRTTDANFDKLLG